MSSASLNSFLLGWLQL